MTQGQRSLALDKEVAAVHVAARLVRHDLGLFAVAVVEVVVLDRAGSLLHRVVARADADRLLAVDRLAVVVAERHGTLEIVSGNRMAGRNTRFEPHDQQRPDVALVAERATLDAVVRTVERDPFGIGCCILLRAVTRHGTVPHGAVRRAFGQRHDGLARNRLGIPPPETVHLGIRSRYRDARSPRKADRTGFFGPQDDGILRRSGTFEFGNLVAVKAVSPDDNRPGRHGSQRLEFLGRRDIDGRFGALPPFGAGTLSGISGAGRNRFGNLAARTAERLRGQQDHEDEFAHHSCVSEFRTAPGTVP